MSTLSSSPASAPRIEEQPRRTNAVGIEKFFRPSSTTAPSAEHPVQTPVNNAVAHITAPRSISLASTSSPPSPTPHSSLSPSPTSSLISEQATHSAQTELTTSSTSKSTAIHRTVNSTDLYNASYPWLAAVPSKPNSYYCRICYTHRASKVPPVNPRSKNTHWIHGSSEFDIRDLRNHKDAVGQQNAMILEEQSEAQVLPTVLNEMRASHDENLKNNFILAHWLAANDVATLKYNSLITTHTEQKLSAINAAYSCRGSAALMQHAMSLSL